MIPTITLGDNLTVSKLGFGGMAVTTPTAQPLTK